MRKLLLIAVVGLACDTPKPDVPPEPTETLAPEEKAPAATVTPPVTPDWKNPPAEPEDWDTDEHLAVIDAYCPGMGNPYQDGSLDARYPKDTCKRTFDCVARECWTGVEERWYFGVPMDCIHGCETKEFGEALHKVPWAPIVCDPIAHQWHRLLMCSMAVVDMGDKSDEQLKDLDIDLSYRIGWEWMHPEHSHPDHGHPDRWKRRCLQVYPECLNP